MGNWWKYLGVLLFVYVILAGMLVPLKPGILSSYPLNVESGTNTILNIEGYNSNFKEESNLRAWLKFSDDYVIQAKKLEVISETKINAFFIFPEYLPIDKKIVESTLVIDSENDGISILPSAVFIKQNNLNVTQAQSNWPSNSLTDLHFLDNFRFPYRNILYETIRNTFFHVAIWMAMFVLLITSLFYSVQYLRTNDMVYDRKSAAITSVAIVYGLIGIATGSIWAKFAWGSFWTADVKLNMSAVAMLIYLAYWILRSSVQNIDSKARLSSIYNIFAFTAMIPLIFVVPRLTDSLHPGNGGNPALGGEDLDNRLRMVFYPSIIALTIIGFWISSLSWRIENIISIKNDRDFLN